MEPEREELTWTCHPARHRWIVAVLVALLVLGLCAGVLASFRDPFLAGLSLVILAASLAPFYLPTRYRMSEDGIEIESIFGARKKAWDLYRRFTVDRHGILLSPFDRPSRLDRFHGLNIRFDAPDRERVIGYVERKIAENVRET